MFRATLCSLSRCQTVHVLIQHRVSDRPVHRLRSSFSTCTPQFLLNLHTPVPSQPAHTCSFSTCTSQFLLNLHAPVPSQLAHTSSFSTCSYQFLLNLHIPVPAQPAHTSSYSTCTPDGHLQSVTIPDAVLIHFDLLAMSTVLLETCRGI